MRAKPRRRWRRWAALLVLLGVAILARGYWNSTRDPDVRSAAVAVADWPAGQAPLRVLLLSDTHVAGPDMPPERLARIVDGLNRLKPDLVMVAGRCTLLDRSAEEELLPLAAERGVAVVAPATICPDRVVSTTPLVVPSKLAQTWPPSTTAPLTVTTNGNPPAGAGPLR